MVKKKQQRTPIKSVAELDQRRRWFLVDASGQVLGRLATRIVLFLRGKNKADFTPHLDGGDYVVVINAAQVKITGNKESGKIYYGHSGYPNGLKAEPLGKLRLRKPQRIIEYAVRGMLPKGRLGARIIKRLKVYAGDRHPHAANQPVILKLDTK